MGRLVATMNITLDGCCHHSHVIADDEFHDHMAAFVGEAEALLFGRNTFELLQGYWPKVALTGNGSEAELRLSKALERKTKHVVSSRPVDPGWNSQQVEVGTDGRTIRGLKDRVHGHLLLVASPRLARSLLEWGLIDEYHLPIQPIVAGGGPRFMDHLGSPQTLELRDSLRLSSGVTINRYHVRAGHQAHFLG